MASTTLITAAMMPHDKLNRMTGSSAPGVEYVYVASTALMNRPITQSTRRNTTVRVAASSSGVPRMVSATLGLSFSAGATYRTARTTSRSTTTPTKMNTMVSTRGSSTLGVLYESAANSPASSNPKSTEIIPSTVSHVIASHAGKVTVGNCNGRTIDSPPVSWSMNAGCAVSPETR